MKNELISVIVPIYKVEKYLEKCISSIINQTYNNIEIILINDGSPDRCGEICDAWAKKDSRIRVFHQENQGVSVARNVGLENMNGIYFTCIDPDDYIEECYIKILLESLIKESADIAFCGLIVETVNNSFIKMINKKYDVLIKKDIELNVFHRGHKYINGGVCKLYKSEIIKKNGLKYIEGLKNGEDHIFLHNYLKYAKKSVNCGKPLYHFVSRSDSASSNVVKDKFSLSMVDYWNSVKNVDFKIEGYPWLFHVLGVALYVFIDCLRHNMKSHSAFIETQNFILKYRWVYLFKKNDCLKIKFKRIIKLFFPNFFVLTAK